MSNILVDIWIGFLKLLFTFLHLVYSCLQYFDLTWTLFKRKLETAFTIKSVNSELYVSRFVTGLGSCPSHLAVIVDDNLIKCRDFTNLVVWSLAAGISFLTVYDQKGILREQELKLYKFFTANTSRNLNQVVFRNFPLQNGKGKNGFKNKLFVSILSGANGKEDFVKWLLDIAQRISCGDLKVESLTPDFISDELEARSKMPDPELAIVAAKEMCSYGFPPWNIRLTEFIRVNTLDGMTVTEFCQILQRYSQCEKRLGK